MQLNELKAVSRFVKVGWQIVWTPQGYYITNEADTTQRLEKARGGVRYYKSLNFAVRLMSNEVGITDVTVIDRGSPKLDLFGVRQAA